MQKQYHGIAVKLRTELLKQKALLALIFLAAVMPFINPAFFSAYNLTDIFKSASVYVTIGCGVTLTVVCAACDLSVGGIMCLSGISVIMLMERLPLLVSVVITLLLGALIGFINGFFIVKQKATAYVITLGMGLLLKGISQLITDAHPVAGSNMAFMKFGNEKLFGGIYYISIVMLAAVVFTVWLLRYTQYGRNCYAVGGDYNIAEYSGINAERTKWIAFIYSGLMGALGGILLSARLNTGASTYGDTTALMINCGAVLGGTSMRGGIGGAWQTALGVFLFTLIENALGMSNLNPYSQKLIEGLIVVLIIGVSSYSQKRKKENV